MTAPPASGARVAAASRELLTGLTAALAAVALGVPTGLLWQAVAPRPLVMPNAGSLDLDTETKAFIAADGLLFLLALAAGVLLALLLWRRARTRALALAVGLCVGGVVGAYIAGRVGVRAAGGQALVDAARAGTRTAPFELPLRVRARQVLLAWPAGSALTVALLVLLRTDPEGPTAAGSTNEHNEPDEPDEPGEPGEPGEPYQPDEPGLSSG